MLAPRYILRNGIITTKNTKLLLKIYKLQGKIEDPKPISEELFNSIHSVAKNINDFTERMFVAIRRVSFENYDAYKTDVFFLSFENSQVDKTLSGFKFLKLLNGIEATNTLLSLQTAEGKVFLDPPFPRESGIMTLFKEFQLEERRKRLADEILKDLGNIKKLYYTLTGTPPQKLYETKVKDLIETKAVYIGTNQRVAIPQIKWEEIFSEEWEGVLWIGLNFGYLKNEVVSRIRTAKETKDKEFYFSLQQAIEQGEYSPVAVSICFIEEAGKNPEGNINKLFANLARDYIPAGTSRMKILEDTPIFGLAREYWVLNDPEGAKNYIPVDVKKTQTSTHPLSFFGRNRFKDFVNFALFDPQEANNPHALVIATSGSGKSVLLLELVKELFGINDYRELYEGKKDASDYFKSNKPKVRIRYFDKGYSGEIAFKLLKLKGFDVELGDVKGELLMNPVEVEEGEEEFAISVINSVLDIEGATPIKGEEKSYLKRVIKTVKDTPEKWYVSRITLEEGITQIFSQPQDLPYKRLLEEIAKDLERKGYKPEEFYKKTLYQIGLEYGYKNFLYPTVMDLTKEVDLLASKPSISPKEREVYESIKAKLVTLKGTPFWLLSRPISMEKRNFFMDLDRVSQNKYFAPFLVTLLRRFINTDKYQKPKDEYAFYIFDEAHTLFQSEHSTEAITYLLDHLAREARKYKISIILATQEFNDIPVSIMSNCATWILPSSGDKTETEKLLSGIEDRIKNLPEELKKIYRHTPPFHALVRNKSGIFTIQTPLSDFEKSIFSADINFLLMPDGVTALVKSIQLQIAEELKREGKIVL